MIINSKSTFVMTNDGQPITVFVSHVVCGLNRNQIFMGSSSTCMNYNMVKIQLYCLSVIGLTQQGEFELYIPMG